MPKHTTIAKAYETLKPEYADAILLFHVGEFYETIKEEARLLSFILNTPLLTGADETGQTFALSGFPDYALETYGLKLTKAGFKVGVCEEVTPPKKSAVQPTLFKT